MPAQGQPQCACCTTAEAPVASDCSVMIGNLVATYYRAVVSGILAGNVGVGICTGLTCDFLNGTFVFGPVPSAIGGSDAEDDASCCVSMPFGPFCEDTGTYAYDTIVLCFKRLSGGTLYQTSVTWETGCGSNTIGFYKNTGSAQDPINFVDEPLATKVNDACCGLVGGTCLLTAIPPP